MSRSYKHTPCCNEHKGKIKKRFANHIIRQKLKNPEFECQHMSYKNAGMDRWDICEYHNIETWSEYWEQELRFHQEFLDNIIGSSSCKPNKKQVYRDWYKRYKMK